MGSIIRKVREKYRAALRYGILDSAPDIDVLLLAKELDAAVVSQDLGIQRWAEQFGLRFMESRSFPIDDQGVHERIAGAIWRGRRRGKDDLNKLS